MDSRGTNKAERLALRRHMIGEMVAEQRAKGWWGRLTARRLERHLFAMLEETNRRDMGD